MTVFRQTATARTWAIEQRLAGLKIGFVPTMGALHEGHLALVRKAKQLADVVAVSIFVNPTQFMEGEDLDRYPRSLDEDCHLLAEHHADAVLIPPVKEMYPDGFQTYVDVTEISRMLEGAVRPGHFRGVATVVNKLFNIMIPDLAVFGQKDYQQLLVIRRLVEDLNMPVDIISHPIVREEDGLAMSSRNRYLDRKQRKKASALHDALLAAQGDIKAGIRDPEEIVSAACTELSEVEVDYVAFVEPNTLQPAPADWERAVMLIAAKVGETRLIDNMVFSREGEEVTA
jgi:pantoate--beta-alanine ligase